VGVAEARIQYGVARMSVPGCRSKSHDARSRSRLRFAGQSGRFGGGARQTRPLSIAALANKTGRVPSRGQSLVEFVIVLPVFLFLMLIAIDFGRLYFSNIEVTNAAREAATYAAANPSDTTGIQLHATQEANSQGQAGESALVVTTTCTDSGGASIACSAASGGAGTGNVVSVKVSESFSFLTPLINGFFGNNLNMSASANAVVLGFAAGAGGTPPAACSPPTASFTVTTSGLTVNLDASSSTPGTGQCAIAGYYWDMGDNANPNPPITGRTVSYTYAAAGGYTITLNTANSNPTYGTTTMGVVVGGAVPTPTPTPTPTATPAPTPTPTPSCTIPTFTWAFTGNGNGVKQHQMTFYGAYSSAPAPTQWSWSFGDSNATTGQTVSDNYPAAGTYTVKLTTTAGACVVSVTNSVTVP
jgi:PKD repeat protein